jgi:gliding motility-associated-like protein
LSFVLLSCLSANSQVLDTICVQGNRQSNLAVPYAAGYTYTWNIGGGTIISNPDSNDVYISWGSQKGLYPISVVATSEKGCISDTTAAFVYLTLPNFARIEGPSLVCPGTEVKLTAYAGSAFSWQGGKSGQTIEFTAKNDTTVFLVALNGRCDNDTTFHTVKVEELPALAFDGPNDTVPMGSFQDFILQNQNTTGFNWIVDGQPMSNDPLYIHRFTHAGRYDIGVAAKFGDCSDTLLKSYYVYEDYKVFIPNAFSPNGDGTNDLFLFKGVGFKSYRALIYTRWGQQIHKWTDKDEVQGWDGTMPNGEKAASGTYLYKIYITDYYGGEKAYQGQLTLIN